MKKSQVNKIRRNTQTCISQEKHNVFFRFLKWFETNWNDRVPKAPYHIYTKSSYSHSSPRKLVGKAWSEAEAKKQVLNLRASYNGVLFFYDENN